MPNPNNNKNPKITALIPYLIVMVFLAFMLFSDPFSGQNKALNYNQFLQALNSNSITTAKVTVGYNTISVSGIMVENGDEYTFSTIIPNTEKNSNEVLEQLQSKTAVTIADANSSNLFLEIISSVLPLLLFGAFGIFMINRMAGASGNKQAFDFSKSRARKEDNIRVRFADVAG